MYQAFLGWVRIERGRISTVHKSNFSPWHSPRSWERRYDTKWTNLTQTSPPPYRVLLPSPPPTISPPYPLFSPPLPSCSLRISNSRSRADVFRSMLNVYSNDGRPFFDYSMYIFQSLELLCKIILSLQFENFANVGVGSGATKTLEKE